MQTQRNVAMCFAMFVIGSMQPFDIYGKYSSSSDTHVAPEGQNATLEISMLLPVWHF